jgi:hypothetical protein
MQNITWYSTNKNLNPQKESAVNSFAEAEKIVDNYVQKWANIGNYTSTEEFQKGDGMDILSQTNFYFFSDDSKTKLEINMGEKYQISFEMSKFQSPLLSWLKYKKQLEISDLANAKEVVKNFFDFDCDSFKNYLER